MDIWQALKKEKRPIVLYGTGNGADRIMDILEYLEIKVSGIFASSAFVRDRSFRGIKVLSFEECKKLFPDMLVLLCFGSSRPEVIENIKKISSCCEILAPDVPVYGSLVFTEDYYRSQLENFNKIRALLADEISVKTFDSLINYKLTGNISYLFSCEESEDDILKLLPVPAGSVYMDFGAYTGDTVLHYSNNFSFSEIIAAEPEKRNFRKLRENTSAIKNILYYNVFISDKNAYESLSASKGRGTHKTEAAFPPSAAHVFTKDGLMYVRTPSPKTKSSADILSCTADYLIKASGIKENTPIFIKADVEGSELRFIKGAANLIKNFTPVMRLSCYHRTEDYLTLPEAVLNLNPAYKLCLRHQSGLPAWDTDYIFIPR